MEPTMSDFTPNEHFPTVPQLASQAVPPVVTRERFADLLGLPPGVIVGWINKGMLPTVTIGKYSLVNVELLRKTCLEREFTL